jgi:hypothetical protein
MLPEGILADENVDGLNRWREMSEWVGFWPTARPQSPHRADYKQSGAIASLSMPLEGLEGLRIRAGIQMVEDSSVVRFVSIVFLHCTCLVC